MTWLNKFLVNFFFVQLLPKLTRNYIKEGYMEKTGPKVIVFSILCRWIADCILREKIRCNSFSVLQHTEGFKKRWFTMDDRRLMYFKDPLVVKLQNMKDCNCTLWPADAAVVLLWSPSVFGISQVQCSFGLCCSTRQNRHSCSNFNYKYQFSYLNETTTFHIDQHHWIYVNLIQGL